SRAQIGVAAVNPFTSHPINIAGNIALLDEASHGRAYLGLARGAWLDFVGVHPQRAVTTLKEAFAAVRHLLSGSTEPLAGEIFPIMGGDSLRWQIQRPDIPFLLGTWGLQTIKACVDYAQEIKLGGTVNPDIVPYYRQQLEQMNGSAAVGIVVGAVTVVDEDGAAAKALARREVALYLPVVATLDKTLEIEPEILAGINTAAAAYDFERAAGFISDELLQKFALAGTPQDIIAQTEALLAAGAARVEFGTPHGLTAAEGLRLLGEKVLSAF
ncbi:MAG: LLM class flavin-dependent oxidoreductase, partial [Anaerolineales bacterium]|nr:LLM class flavin-dependent oxidoreductase [Anaerolineales bacterium]